MTIFKSMRWLTVIILVAALSACQSKEESTSNAEDWISLFNGKDLTGWDIKIAGYDLNDNYNNTFRIQDSTIVAAYDGYINFTKEFGHLYYKTPYSYYRVRMQYQFFGKQAPGGPDYAFLNSGVMVHSQSAQSLDKDQTFPVSLEMQFLACDSLHQRPTGNLCTPGTGVHMNGEATLAHCIDSDSKFYNESEWISAEVIVLGDSVIHHVVNGDTVLTYQQPFITDIFVGGGMNWTAAGFSDSLQWINKNGQLLKEGYIALQAESHPVAFKKIELLNLKGCMDKKAKNHKAYFIKADNSTCEY